MASGNLFLFTASSAKSHPFTEGSFLTIPQIALLPMLFAQPCPTGRRLSALDA
jgi:hypothetical protein